MQFSSRALALETKNSYKRKLDIVTSLEQFSSYSWTYHMKILSPQIKANFPSRALHICYSLF